MELNASFYSSRSFFLQKLYVDKKTQLIIKFKKFIVLIIILFKFAKLGVLCGNVSI